jgi:hypothetical protein
MLEPIDVRRPGLVDRFGRDWAEGMLERAALTDAERVAVTDAIGRCYERAGLARPARVVWAPSPLAGRLLAADLARRYAPLATRIRAAATLVRNAAGTTVGGLLAYGCCAALNCAAVALVLLFALPGDAVWPTDPELTVPAAHWRGAWIGGIVGGLLMIAIFVWIVTDGMPDGVLGSLGHGVLIGVLFVVFGASAAPALIGSYLGYGLSALLGGSSPPSQEWVTTLLTLTLVPAVAVAAVAGIVIKWLTERPEPLRCADAAHERLDRHLSAALDAALAAAGTVPGDHTQVRDTVNELAVHVDQSIDPAVQWAARARLRWIDRYPVGHFGARYGAGRAAATWLSTDGAPVPADAEAVVSDFTAASRAGWWWPHTRFVVVSERPSALHLERVEVGARAPAGRQRLHRTDGPSAQWPDGYRVYALHGTGVPADLVEHGWDVDAIHRHPNSEVRRAAIELIGWTEYIRRAGWRLVATAPDPGNPPHELALYEDPSRRLRDVRVLVMTNGSPDRSGALRRYAETVPDTIDDPVAAAAWQYGCNVRVYRQLRRRT